ncbi:MAG: ECF transporter S component [Candidatus Limnocylindrales bacterium]
MTSLGTGSGDAMSVAAPDGRWRTRDILVAAIIGVAFGVVFWAWGLAWSLFEPLNALFPVARDLLYAVWLVPAVLAPLVIQKPGAALFAEMVAAGVSALLGSAWGVDTLLSGFAQGAAAEIVFAFLLYRNFSLPVLMAAAVASAAAAWLHDWVLYYPDIATDVQLARGLAMAISSIVIVALGSRALARSLRRSGVLDGFPG